MKGTKKETKDLQVTSWEVTRAYEFKDGNISFDMMLNGIHLYGLSLVWYKKEKRYFIGFPSKKVGDQYYNHYWFMAGDELTEAVTLAIESLLEDKKS